MSVPISVLICCANVEDTLEAACKSVSWADELIIVDSGSKDATENIARRFATKYIKEPWRGHGKQKQFGVTFCKNDWILILDGDEEVSDVLKNEILALTAEELEKYDMCYVRRKNYIMGRHVRAWWPDWQSRLINRYRVIWNDEVLHDARLPLDPKRVLYLKGWLEHKRTSKAGFADYFSGKRLDDRILLVAQQAFQRGKRVCGWELALRPMLTFIKFYILKLGFLDGTFGLLIAQKASMGVQLKYAALWAIQNNLIPAKEESKLKSENLEKQSL